jgi:hypothetical protein
MDMKRRTFLGAIAGVAVAPAAPSFSFPNRPIFPTKEARFAAQFGLGVRLTNDMEYWPGKVFYVDQVAEKLAESLNHTVDMELAREFKGDFA